MQTARHLLTSLPLLPRSVGVMPQQALHPNQNQPIRMEDNGTPHYWSPQPVLAHLSYTSTTMASVCPCCMIVLTLRKAERTAAVHLQRYHNPSWRVFSALHRIYRARKLRAPPAAVKGTHTRTLACSHSRHISEVICAPARLLSHLQDWQESAAINAVIDCCAGSHMSRKLEYVLMLGEVNKRQCSSSSTLLSRALIPEQ
jgi:hypothetical protein